MLPDYIKDIKDKENTRVFVAMSGGVDSSVAAYLLKEAGFAVTGCFMTVWQPPFLDCSQEVERQDAMRVAAQLGIDFQTVDLADVYKKQVVDYMIREYEAGRTPNPDVMCNGVVKFGVFYDWAREQGADYIATGHYARLRRAESRIKTPPFAQGYGGARHESRVHLLSGVDEQKDQTYFLWQVPQERLQRSLFPIGGLEKSRVREIAAAANLPVANKQDSQGLCFLGQIDMRDFLQEFITTEAGAVLNEAGEKIGRHEGVVLYTIGQRHGFTVTKKTPDSGPWYVVDKDTDRNTITVSEDTSKQGATYNCATATLTDTNWITPPPVDRKLQARIRYNQPLQTCTLEGVEREGQATVRFTKPQRAVALGQSCVVYDGEVCCGGGIISRITRAS